MGCPWCDTRHTWVVDPEREVAPGEVLDRSNESDGWSKMSTEDIWPALPGSVTGPVTWC